MKHPRRRWLKLVLLAGAVVAAHLLALRGWPAAPPAPPEPGRLSLALRPQAQPPEPPATTSPSTPPTTPAPVPVPTLQPVATTPPPAKAKEEAAPSPAPAPTAAAVVPPPVRLRYAVRARSHGIELPGQAELEWRHDGRDYELRLSLHAPLLPTRTQRSTGQLTAQGLAPTRFSDHRRSEEATHFDRRAQQITFSNNRAPVPLQDGAQDRLSVLMQLGALLSASGGAGRDTLSLQVAGTGDAEPWQFHIEGEETLELPGGRVRALRLVRLPRHEYDQKLELWLAPGQDYAPVRLRLTGPEGEWMDQQWAGSDRP